ncbi:MAG: cob(I)yrinic acid a,c-diamide adenosyltransferase [Acidobacteriota bacterium]|nr:cob(I)yrinic acid a,c-diamide adenosyltransferase [Acidobacteriota bacterium]
MPRITKVYTKTGDDGTTGLGVKKRVRKDDPRVEAYGSVDELSSILGVAFAEGLDETLVDPVRRIQNDLFHLGSDLCIPEEDKQTLEVPTIEARHVDMLESWIDEWSESLEPLANFILPGGTRGAATLHWARTVCRRAERRLVTLEASEPIGPYAVRYLNRLSDLLFVAARYENQAKQTPETLWDSHL